MRTLICVSLAVAGIQAADEELQGQGARSMFAMPPGAPYGLQGSKPDKEFKKAQKKGVAGFVPTSGYYVLPPMVPSAPIGMPANNYAVPSYASRAVVLPVGEASAAAGGWGDQRSFNDYEEMGGGKVPSIWSGFPVYEEPARRVVVPGIWDPQQESFSIPISIPLNSNPSAASNLTSNTIVSVTPTLANNPITDLNATHGTGITADLDTPSSTRTIVGQNPHTELPAVSATANPSLPAITNSPNLTNSPSTQKSPVSNNGPVFPPPYNPYFPPWGYLPSYNLPALPYIEPFAVSGPSVQEHAGQYSDRFFMAAHPPYGHGAN